MKTALLKANDTKAITANEATARNERQAFCPECKEAVRLHRKARNGQAAHFEHLSRGGKCSLYYNR